MEILNNIENYFLIFIIYSIIGWLIEVILNLISNGKFINRGFLIGPYCPIYGVGSLTMTFLLSKYENNLIILFGMSMLICTFLEYITSYVMEKLFKARWWDYSDEKFNLNGRVCLKNSVLFGLAGIVLIKFANNFFFRLINDLSFNGKQIIFFGILIIFIVDAIISYIIIHNFEKLASNYTKDSTEEISTKVSNAIDEYKEKIASELKELANIISLKISSFRETKTNDLRIRLSKKSYFYRRLVKAFPKFEIRTSKEENIKNNFLTKIKAKK